MVANGMVASGRRLFGLVTIGLVAMTTWLVVGVAAATDAAPIPVDGNATCGQLGELAGQPGWAEFYKAEPAITGSHSAGDRTVLWTVRDTAEGQVFDWTSNFYLHGVFAKGGNTGGYLYVYPAGALSDEGLHAPVNPSGTWGGLSHISFCYNSTTETSTTPSTETSTTPSTETSTTPSTETSTTPSTETSATPSTESAGDTVAASTETSRLEVLGTTVSAPVSTAAGISETLPFTGFALDTAGGIAFSLVSLGGLILLSLGYRPWEGRSYRGSHRRPTRFFLRHTG